MLRLWSSAQQRLVVIEYAPRTDSGPDFVVGWSMAQRYEGPMPHPSVFKTGGPQTDDLMALPEPGADINRGFFLRRNAAYLDQQYARTFDWVACIAVPKPQTIETTELGPGARAPRWSKQWGDARVRPPKSDRPAAFISRTNAPDFWSTGFVACEYGGVPTVSDDWRDYAVEPQDFQR